MMKLAFAVLLLGIVSAFNLNYVDSFDEESNFLESVLDQDQPKNHNDEPFQDVGQEYEDDFRDDDEFGEIEAIQGHVKYQDAARDTLLKFAAELRKGKNVTNAFFKVIDEFEKGIAEFHAALRRRRISPDAISGIEKFIKEAAKDRSANTKVLRALTSQGLFVAARLGEDSARKRDFLSLGAKEFLNTIKEEIGVEAFEDFLSVEGLVTLMFAIDDTGSMSDEIRAAIAISEQIVNASRDIDVDYILSPFNDPDTGPLTVKNKTEGAAFLTALRALNAHGGGDCPELAFTGMINALESGYPQPGSSMFVFTDASPKDAEKKDILLDLSHSLEIKINFFISRVCSDGANQAFNDVARETNGIVYTLSRTIDVVALGKVVANSLQGSASMGSGGSASTGKKRSSDIEYPISVDDSVEKLTITVTTQNPAAGIKLSDPTRNLVTVGRTLLKKGVIYNIDSPVTGVYKLTVPASAGKHQYIVSGGSSINIDFGHYYVIIARRGTRIPIPLDQPLQGFPAKVFITIAGSESVKPKSLRLKVVSKSGDVHADKPLTAVGTSGARYFVRFDPPTEPFKLHLHGLTVHDNPFVRETSSEDQTVPVILKLSYKEDSNVLRRGQITRILVLIRRGDTSVIKQKYTLSLKDERGYGRVSRQPRAVYSGRTGIATIEFNVPADAPARKTENVKLLLTRDGETTAVASLLFSFLLV